MSYVVIASVAIAGPAVVLAALTQYVPRQRWRSGYRLHMACKKLLLSMAGSAAWPGYAPPVPHARAADSFARRLLAVLSGQTVSGTEKGDEFQVVHTEPLMELPTDYVDPNWGWIVQNSARARRDQEVADEVTPLLWRMARGMGLDRDTARQVVLRAAADSALRLRSRDAADLRAVMLAAVQREAAKLDDGQAVKIESDPLASAPQQYRCALTVLAYGHPADTAPLLENMGASGDAAMAWWRDRR